MSLFDGVVNDRHRAELLATGHSGQGTVTGVRSLGKASAAGFLTEITLQIEPVTGSPFARTIREWLPQGSESQFQIGTRIPVRFDRKAAVLEASPGAAAALGQAQATWTAQPPPPSGSFVPMPGQMPPGFAGGTPQMQVNGLDIGALVNQALQSGNFTVVSSTVDPVADAPRLLATGIQATATVLDVTDVPLGSTQLTVLQLHVEPSGAAPFEAALSIRFSTPERRAAVSQGARVPVRYDPADHSKVVLDSRAMGFGG